VLLGTGDLGVIHILEWEAVNIDVEHIASFSDTASFSNCIMEL